MSFWATSDTHFFHDNILRYCSRPFDSTYLMHKAFIENWNAVVTTEDIVYHLGDVAMGGAAKANDVKQILSQLNGKIKLIKGNHDTYVLRNPCFSMFDSVCSKTILNYNGIDFQLTHHPPDEWDKDSISLHGHTHGAIDEDNLITTRLDVGVDSHNYTPISFDDIILTMKSRGYFI